MYRPVSPFKFSAAVPALLLAAPWMATGLSQTPAPAPAAAPSGAPAPAPTRAPGAPAPAAGDPAAAGAGSQVDPRLPGVDPAAGLLRFNGQTWDVRNNAVFAARFEKYLNTPEETGQLEAEHRAILNKIIALLDPSNMRPTTIDDAYRLLARASTYPGDARLSDTLSTAIYGVWQSKRNQSRLADANRILQEERERARHNMSVRAADDEGQTTRTSAASSRGNTAQKTPAPAAPSNNAPSSNSSSDSNKSGGNLSIGPNGVSVGGNSDASSNSSSSTPAPQDPAALASAMTGTKAVRMAGYAETMIESATKITANSAKSELSELQAKLEYQGLLVQLFLQRRFHHVVIGARFYRSLFTEGDSKLNLPQSSKSLFDKGTGMPPTVATLESLANEAMRDVQTSVQAFHRLVELGELDSASKRLSEAFIIGEYMPELRTLPYERKRKVVAFVQKGNQLRNAVETKDYAVAAEILQWMKSSAKDFDGTQVNALIETARNAARLHLGRARNAAISGDKATFESAIQEAGKIWPNNPELAEVAAKAFNQGDQFAQAMNELDQLISQRNFRRIADDAGRFLAAAQSSPERLAQVKKILDDFKSIEVALMGAKEMDRQGNPAGAWETVDKVAQKFPDDLQLNQARALYTTRASDFVRMIQNAEEHERRNQTPTSLAWYLKAQRAYPKSDLAEDAIQRLKSKVMPAEGL